MDINKLEDSSKFACGTNKDDMSLPIKVNLMIVELNDLMGVQDLSKVFVPNILPPK